MKEFYGGPVIDNFYHQSGGIILPEEAYETPQERIADLREGEWGVAPARAVYRDLETEKVLLDTFEAQEAYVTRQSTRTDPFIMPVRIEPGAPLMYMLDARNLRSLHFPFRDADLDLGEDAEPFQRRQKRFGSQVIRVIIIRHHNNVVARGEKELKEPAKQFVGEVDAFLRANWKELDEACAVRVPSNVLAESETRFHVNVENELIGMTHEESIE